MWRFDMNTQTLLLFIEIYDEIFIDKYFIDPLSSGSIADYIVDVSINARGIGNLVELGEWANFPCIPLVLPSQ
jgi:hypothetical protein